MPFSYTIDHENRCVYETWTGEITAKDLADFWRRFLADPVVLAIRRTIVDLRACRLLFNREQLTDLVENIVLPVMNGKTWKSAIVIADSIQFEVTRQYHVLAESYSRDSVFSTPEAAMAWMQTQSP